MAVTDLTGYMWNAKTDEPFSDLSIKYINFTSNGTSFSSIETVAKFTIVLYYNNIGVAGAFDGIIDPAYKTITINGGADVSNSTFIAWLEANGTLTAPAPATPSITNIYKGNLERSDIQKIYKGTTLLYEKVLPPQGETWVINERPSISTSDHATYNINFISNNVNYTSLTLSRENNYANQIVMYNAIAVYDHREDWLDEAYRTITFETSPSGNLLVWLQANAVKQ